MCYEYFDSWNKLYEKQLPSIDNFYRKLKGEGIVLAAYVHANNFWRTFNIKTLGEYYKTYCALDVWLLADVFETFRDIAIEEDGLDPLNYLTLPGFCWDSLLTQTSVVLDLPTEREMVDMIDQRIRGGITQAIKNMQEPIIHI